MGFMNIDIKNCVGKNITFKINEAAGILETGIVEQYVNDNTVKIGGSYYDPSKIIVTSVIGDAINESGNGGEQLIKG